MKTTAKTVQTMKRCGQWATALSAIAISLIVCTASAKDNVPTKATSSGQTISSTPNPDGSLDNIIVEVGVSTVLGRYTGLLQLHVDAGQYDPATHTFRLHFTVSGTDTAANGDTTDFTADGVEIVPLDASFMPLPPPYAFHSTWEIVGGTGRFAGATGHGTAEGFDYGDGTSSRIDTGVVSTVGSNRRPSAEL
jgi:hypothetical protein